MTMTITQAKQALTDTLYSGGRGRITPEVLLELLNDLTDAINADKASLASPPFTGTPTAPTASLGTDTTQIATTAFTKAAVDAAIAALINSAPGALDTLDELAAALGDNANYAATITSALALKAPLASPALTGTPTAPTVAGTTDDSTKIATTAFVQAVVAAISSGSVTYSSVVTALGFTPSPETRSVSASGLASGGGNLSADRTIDVPIASQAEAQAGSINTKAMTPLRTAEAIAALGKGAKAWVRFTGSTGVIVSSSGVSSVTRNSTGDYTVNFSAAFANTNYAWVADSNYDSGGSPSRGARTHTISAGSFRFTIENTSGSNFDPANVCISFYAA